MSLLDLCVPLTRAYNRRKREVLAEGITGVPGLDRNGTYGYQLTNDLHLAEVRPPRRRWITAGLTLGGGTPLIVAVGLGFALAISLLIGRFLPQPRFFLLWFTGVAVSAVPLWYLVAGCIRAGGWRALFVGVGLVFAVAVASYGLGSVTRAAQPEPYRMAGAAWIIFGYVLGLAGVLVLAMGGVAMRLQDRRSAGRGHRKARSGRRVTVTI